MKCYKIKALLFDYVTHRLNESIYEEVNSHLINCKVCEKELKELKGTLKLLDLARPPRLPNDFHDSLMRKVSEIIDREELTRSADDIFDIAAQKGPSHSEQKMMNNKLPTVFHWFMQNGGKYELSQDDNFTIFIQGPIEEGINTMFMGSKSYNLQHIKSNLYVMLNAEFGDVATYVDLYNDDPEKNPIRFCKK